MSIAAQLKKANIKQSKVEALPPLWEGPASKGPQGGVTQSLLSRYLTCKERFRIIVMDGLKPHPRFEARMEFGNMWHACEEAVSGGDSHPKALADYVKKLCAKYPLQREEINHWYAVTKELFPAYLAYWRGSLGEAAAARNKRISLCQELAFDVDYRLPSGRTVRLRGKWDELTAEPNGKGLAVHVGDHKTKSQIDKVKIVRQLGFDLQMMFYLVAASTEDGKDVIDGLVVEASPKRADWKLAGIRYNVVRRSSHKTAESMMEKVHKDVATQRGGEWFARWTVAVPASDIMRFRVECLDPLLENLLDDHEWWHSSMTTGGKLWDYQDRAHYFPNHANRHYRAPFYYNPLSEGGSSDLDGYLETGSTTGLSRADTLFRELET